MSFIILGLKSYSQVHCWEVVPVSAAPLSEVPLFYITVLSSLPTYSRALQLALKHKTHVDTVLAFREKYLSELNTKETLTKFIECQGKVCMYILLL